MQGKRGKEMTRTKKQQPYNQLNTEHKGKGDYRIRYLEWI